MSGRLRQKRWIVVLLLGGLVAVLGVQALRDATAPRPPGRIAVEYHSRSQGTEIYTLDADRGTNPRRLTTSSSAANPIWSPDGQHLLFTAPTGSHRSLYAITVHGDQQTALTSDVAVGLVAWSPDSYHIAFTTFNAQDEPSVSLINADGTGLIRLDVPSFDPAWAPDGQRLAFIAEYPARGIYIINADGTGLTLLVAGETTPPTWSPDGQRIVFFANQPTPGLYTVNPEGSSQTQLVAGVIDTPRWAPDGQHLAFQQLTQDHWMWMVMRPDGTEITPLMEGDLLTWSPDGKRLAVYQSGPLEHDMIMVMNADGTDRRAVARDMEISGSLSWSPDSQWLAFPVTPISSLILLVSEWPKAAYATVCMYLGLSCPPTTGLQYQSAAVYAVRADGSNLTLVSQLPGASEQPAWQPAP